MNYHDKRWMKLLTCVFFNIKFHRRTIFRKGIVKSSRSIWHLRTIPDFFWAVINFICVFFATMFSMEKSDGYKKLSGSSNKWDGGGPRGPLQGLDNVRDIKHNMLCTFSFSKDFNLVITSSNVDYSLSVPLFRFSSSMWIMLWWLKYIRCRVVQQHLHDRLVLPKVIEHPAHQVCRPAHYHHHKIGVFKS